MTGLGWSGIVRLGLVQSALGALVMFSTVLLNRIMVVEYALPAALPAALVAWHYAVQLSRPAWGHGSDKGRWRTPWILGGIGTLAIGTLLAVDAVAVMAYHRSAGVMLAVLAFSLIGAGVGAAGTSLLALLSSHVAPERRSAAAALTWIMMIVGIVVTAGVTGSLIDPFTIARLAYVASGVALIAAIVTVVGVWGVERSPGGGAARAPVALTTALGEIWADVEARRFTVFVFVSMLAYSMQDMILEPFAGLMFAYTPGNSAHLAAAQHMGVLAGMILVGFGGAIRSRKGSTLRAWAVGGCLASAVALVGLALAARFAPDWPLVANVALLGFANGVFAVAAIGAMMQLAGAGGDGRHGVRMGVWGAAQAIAFGSGGLVGAVAVDVLRASGANGQAFGTVFAVEALLFLAAAWLAAKAVVGPQIRTTLAGASA